jgi:hypothetical protein
MAGLATATIVPSSATIITPRATVSRVSVGLPRIRPVPATRAGDWTADRATPAVAAVFISMTSSLPCLVS